MSNKTATLKEQRPLAALAERVKTKWFMRFILVLIPYSLLLTPSCSPEAKWTTDDVDINMEIATVSAGFVECNFSTNKEAYYLIACVEAKPDENPVDHPKQFMTLALDSANVEYLAWRNTLLKQGEFNIAPFASHALQYGSVNHFFTGLWPGQEYWIYAFVVNPKTLQPSGKLYLETVKTTEESIMDIHFEYRIKGKWDYIYPVDEKGTICSRFPYIATTRDSSKLSLESFSDLSDSVRTYIVDSLISELPVLVDDLTGDLLAYIYLYSWTLDRFAYPDSANVLYGVKAVENDGWSSNEEFTEGQTYYTLISGYDGSFKQTTIYKFKWSGDSCNLYFHDTDSANIVLYFNE